MAYAFIPESPRNMNFSEARSTEVLAMFGAAQ